MDLFALSIPRSPGSKQILLRIMLNQTILSYIDQIVVLLDEDHELANLEALGLFETGYNETVRSVKEPIPLKRSECLEVIGYICNKYPKYSSLFKCYFYEARGSINSVIAHSTEYAERETSWNKFDSLYD